MQAVNVQKYFVLETFFFFFVSEELCVGLRTRESRTVALSLQGVRTEANFVSINSLQNLKKKAIKTMIVGDMCSFVMKNHLLVSSTKILKQIFPTFRV